MTTHIVAAREDRATRESTPAPRSAGFARLLKPVKDQVSVEQVAEDLGVSLRRAGPGRLVGLCPLHSEKTPSFTVWTEEDRWYCFGACQCGGDVLDLWQQARSIPDNKDALLNLAGEYGVEPEPRPDSWFRKQERQKSARELLDETKLYVLRRRLMRVIEPLIADTEDPELREELAEAAWKRTLPMARTMLEEREVRKHE